MDVDRIEVHGEWWRQIPGSGDVHYLGDPTADSRWQRGYVIDALYFGDEPDTAWAEWYRYLAEAGIPPGMALPRDLWKWSVHVDQIADLSDETRLSRVGLARPVPGRHDWPHFQRVGEALYADGYRGLLAPSAARPAYKVLCLFREDRIVTGTNPVPPPEFFATPPRVPKGMTT